MQKQEKIDEWVKIMNKRKVLSPSGLIMAVNDDNLSLEDLKVLGLKWHAQPCPRLSARLSYPHLLHSAPPSKGIRRTIRP